MSSAGGTIYTPVIETLFYSLISSGENLAFAHSTPRYLVMPLKQQTNKQKKKTPQNKRERALVAFYATPNPFRHE